MSDHHAQGLSKLHFGWQIEAQAEAWFLKQFPQARLLKRNFRCRIGEIDLIFEEPLQERAGTELVFLEVRARLDGSWVGGLESVGPVKQRRLAQTIRWYLAGYRGRARSVRLDVLAWDGVRFEHYRNLWPLTGV